MFEHFFAFLHFAFRISAGFSNLERKKAKNAKQVPPVWMLPLWGTTTRGGGMVYTTQTGVRASWHKCATDHIAARR